MNSLLYLVFGHYVCDFALQNDFVAKFKAPWSAPFWLHVMTAHCAIHALPVLLITGSPSLAVSEFACHFVIDCRKCQGKLSFTQDQLLHLICKLVWFCIFKGVV